MADAGEVAVALEPPIVDLLTLSLRDALAAGTAGTAGTTEGALEPPDGAVLREGATGFGAGAGAEGFEYDRDDPLMDEEEDLEDEDREEEDRELLPLPEAVSTPPKAMAAVIARIVKH